MVFVFPEQITARRVKVVVPGQQRFESLVKRPIILKAMLRPVLQSGEQRFLVPLVALGGAVEAMRAVVTGAVSLLEKRDLHEPQDALDCRVADLGSMKTEQLQQQRP